MPLISKLKRYIQQSEYCVMYEDCVPTYNNPKLPD